jgi:hypothetical protein
MENLDDADVGQPTSGQSRLSLAGDSTKGKIGGINNAMAENESGHPDGASSHHASGHRAHGLDTKLRAFGASSNDADDLTSGNVGSGATASAKLSDNEVFPSPEAAPRIADPPHLLARPPKENQTRRTRDGRDVSRAGVGPERNVAVHLVKCTRNDILCGRGVPIQKNPGNIRMHRIVESYRVLYRDASRQEKSRLVRRIIHEITEEGARFLIRPRHAGSQYSDDQLWAVADNETVYEKISHALRGQGTSRPDPDDWNISQQQQQHPPEGHRVAANRQETTDRVVVGANIGEASQWQETSRNMTATVGKESHQPSYAISADAIVAQLSSHQPRTSHLLSLSSTPIPLGLGLFNGPQSAGLSGLTNQAHIPGSRAGNDVLIPSTYSPQHVELLQQLQLQQPCLDAALARIDPRLLDSQGAWASSDESELLFQLLRGYHGRHLGNQLHQPQERVQQHWLSDTLKQQLQQQLLQYSLLRSEPSPVTSVQVPSTSNLELLLSIFLSRPGNPLSPWNPQPP